MTDKRSRDRRRLAELADEASTILQPAWAWHDTETLELARKLFGPLPGFGRTPVRVMTDEMRAMGRP